MNNREEQNIEIMLNYNCNFKCKYCFEHIDGVVFNACDIIKMDVEVAKSVVSYINNLLEIDEKFIVLNLWGGEPTLSRELIDFFIEEYKKVNRVEFRIFTNGYDIEHLLSLTKDVPINRFSIQVSYDYSLQKKNRIHKKDPSSSDKVLKNIITLAKLGYNVSTKSTILYEDILLIKDYYLYFANVKKILLKYNLSNYFGLNITIDTENKNHNIVTVPFLREFEKQIKEIAILELKNNYNFNWFSFDKALCSAGKKFFCVDVDGLVYVCHSALFSKNKKDFLLGNLHEDINKGIYNNYTLLNTDIQSQPDVCKKCNVSFCHRCNIHTYDVSKLVKFDSRFHDFANNETRCNLYKIITKYFHVINKVKRR